MQPRLLKHPARLAGASLLRLQDDQRLVALAREGHDPAFAAIVDRYGRQLERYCARLLGPGRAEDAVQQAFVNAHAAMRATDDELALKPWLYRIAHNAALNILRASRDEDEVLDAERPGAVQTAEIVELRERMRETLASIQARPAAQRDALLLRELEGRSHEEIAAALGISEGGARQHLHRARVSLRAAASAITPYPVLARVLSASADEGARSADIVSGAGLGAGAGAIKMAAGVLAAGAIAGGAVGVHHHRPAQPRAGATHTSTSRSTTATSEANRPSAGLLTIADHQSAGAASDRGHGRGAGGARGHGHRQSGRGDGRSPESGRRPAGVLEDHTGSSGSGGSSGNEKTGEHSGSHDGSGSSGSGSSGSGSSGSDSSGSGSSGSGSSGSGGSDDTTTEASHDGSTTTTTSDGGSSGGSGESSTTTTTTTTDSSGSDGGLSSGSDDAKTTDG
jgi:RNA polymerase sigma factor (sigma-70 family)